MALGLLKATDHTLLKTDLNLLEVEMPSDVHVIDELQKEPAGLNCQCPRLGESVQELITRSGTH